MPRLQLKKNLCAALAAILISANFTSDHAVAADSLGNLPDLGDAASADLSAQDEKQLGRLIMRDYRGYGVVNSDPEITAYLNELGRNIVLAAGESPANFEFFLVTNSAINAFALPGGYIGVHTGLLAAARTESELASVLAHEVGHVTQRHIARMFGQQKQTNLVAAAAMIAAILVASSNPQAAQGIAAAGAGYQIDQQLGFSRDAEREADRVGYNTLVSAGFDPNGMVSFFERLQQGSRFYGNDAPEYLRTHPLTTARIADIRNRVGDKAPLRPDTGNLSFELIRMKAAVYADQTTQQLSDRLESLNNPNLQLPFSDPVALQYGRSLVLRKLGKNQEALDQVTKAIGSATKRIAQAGRTTPTPLMLSGLRLAILVDLRLALNKGERSPVRTVSNLNSDDAELLTTLQAFRSSYGDSAITRGIYARGLIAMGLYETAQTYLRQFSVVLRSDPVIYELLAECSFALGNLGEHHLNLAQHYAAKGAYFPAVEQTEIALRYTKDNYYLTSEIQSKQRQYKMLAEESRRQLEKFSN